LLKLSWKAGLIRAACRRPGRMVTALVYGLGGRFFTREFYRAQAALAAEQPQAGGGRLSLSFDIDYPEDARALPELCDLLAQLGLTCSFAVIGKLVEAYPAEHRKLVSAGHELLNHTYSHPDHEIFHPHESFDDLALSAQKEQIERCHKVCQDILGASMTGFRAPHFGNVTGRTFYQALNELNYSFSSSLTAVASSSFGLPFRAEEGILEFPVTCCPRHPFAVLDTWHALRKSGARHTGKGELRSLVLEAAALVSESRGYLNLYLDPRDVLEFEEAKAALTGLAESPVRLASITYAGYLQLLRDNPSLG